MKSAAKNIQLASYDDLFKTDEERQADAQERIQNLPLDKLEPFPNHPFKVIDDDKMLETVESIKERGVLVPILVRPKNDGNFEIVSGHRRHHASQLAGLTEIPAIVREMDDDTAILLMVDSNLQREELLPSEKAFAYKMKLDAMKRQTGRKPKENDSRIGNHFDTRKSSDVLAEQTGDSKNQIFRYIRLTYLVPDLLDRETAWTTRQWLLTPLWKCPISPSRNNLCSAMLSSARSVRPISVRLSGSNSTVRTENWTRM